MTNEQPAADHIVTRNKKEPPALGPGVIAKRKIVIVRGLDGVLTLGYTTDGSPYRPDKDEEVFCLLDDVPALVKEAAELRRENERLREGLRCIANSENAQAPEEPDLDVMDDESSTLCGECSFPMTLVRPGKHQCELCNADLLIDELQKENKQLKKELHGYQAGAEEEAAANDDAQRRIAELEAERDIERSARKTAEQAVGRLEVERETLRELVRETKQEKSAKASELDRLERQLRRREGFTGGELSLEEHHLREELRDFCKRAAAALNPTEETE